ncbi:MAG: hypothetical protein U0931_35935 [Vulcanimicrobiota bacterium]
MTTPLRRPALRAERLAELAAVICPGCYRNECLMETVAPTDQHTGHYACKADGCSWSGPGKALHPDRTPEQASKTQATDRWGTSTDKDVAGALAEERRRGKKGGGSSSATGKAKKQGSKASRYRADRDENVWVKLRVANPLTNIVRLPEVNRCNEDFRKALAR